MVFKHGRLTGGHGCDFLLKNPLEDPGLGRNTQILSMDFL